MQPALLSKRSTNTLLTRMSEPLTDPREETAVRVPPAGLDSRRDGGGPLGRATPGTGEPHPLAETPPSAGSQAVRTLQRRTRRHAAAVSPLAQLQRERAAPQPVLPAPPFPLLRDGGHPIIIVIIARGRRRREWHGLRLPLYQRRRVYEPAGEGVSTPSLTEKRTLQWAPGFLAKHTCNH